MIQELLSQEEAELFLKDINKPVDNSDTSIIDTSNVDTLSNFYEKNITLIEEADKEILSRIKYGDENLTIKDLIGVKAEAFKQNQLIKGKDTEIDNTKIIPTNINIQVNIKK